MEDDELNPNLKAPKSAEQADLFLPRLRLPDILKLIAVLLILDVISFFIFGGIVYAINHGEVEQLRDELDRIPQDVYLICRDIDSGDYLVLSRYDPYQDSYTPRVLPGNGDRLEAAYPLCHTTLSDHHYAQSISTPLPNIKGYEYVANPLDEVRDGNTDTPRIDFCLDTNGIYLVLHYRKITT